MSEQLIFKFQGTPVEAGNKTFEALILPVLAGIKGRNKIEVQQFYAGLLISIMGSMAADFGHDNAIEIVEALSETFTGMKYELSGATTH